MYPQYNQFPMAYPMNNTFMQTKTPTISQGMNWVIGIEGAKAAYVPPGTTTPFFDSEKNRVFIKTADNVGMCTIRTLDLNEPPEDKKPDKIDLSQYVTKKELTEMLNEIKGERKDEFISAASTTEQP